MVPLLTKAASPHSHPWAFQKVYNTECAVTFVVNVTRKGYRHCAVLDLQKVYDTVPRKKLLDIMYSRLLRNLADMARSLRLPTLFRVQEQSRSSFLRTKTGVLLGDSPRSALFNLFMDVFLSKLNDLTAGIASCIAGDETLLAPFPTTLQEMRSVCSVWALTSGMKWSVAKSHEVFTTSSKLWMGGHRLPHSAGADLLKARFTAVGTIKRRLLDRLQAAAATLLELQRSLKSWRTTYSQHSFIVETFVSSPVDYVTFPQPVTDAVQQASRSPERKAAAVILNVRIPNKKDARALVLSNLLPFKSRRLLPMTSCVKCFRFRALQDDASMRELHCDSILRTYGTVRGIFRRHGCPNTVSEIGS